jgi:hypothetical protein
VSLAESGEDALEQLETAELRGAGPVSLILLDLVMPGMGGTGMLRRLKTSPKFAGVPVIVLSSLGDKVWAWEPGGACALGVSSCHFLASATTSLIRPLCRGPSTDLIMMMRRVCTVWLFLSLRVSVISGFFMYASVHVRL